MKHRVFGFTALLAAVAVMAWGLSAPLPFAVMPALVGALVLGLFMLEKPFGKDRVAWLMTIPVISAFLIFIWRRAASDHTFARWLFTESWRTVTWHDAQHAIHLDTLLFILSLSAFAEVFAQARVLESLIQRIMMRGNGRRNVYWLVSGLVVGTALIAGVLDGVSMIGLLMSMLLIVFRAAKVELRHQRNAMVYATFVATFCGAWLAFGEPPNLVMRAGVVNTHGVSLLTDWFFLSYCGPPALLGLVVVCFFLRHIKGEIVWEHLDVFVQNDATVRFLQAMDHGTALDPEAVVRLHLEGAQLDSVLANLRSGMVLGKALVEAKIAREAQVQILGAFSGGADRGEALVDHYDPEKSLLERKAAAQRFYKLIYNPAMLRLKARGWAVGGFVVFLVLLIAHTLHHSIPVWLAPIVGAMIGYVGLPRGPMRRLVQHQALHQMKEYIFLPPLFLSISLLGETHFFESFQPVFQRLIEVHGTFLPAEVQLFATTFLSALADNNVVAGAGAQFLTGLPLHHTWVFAMSQIMGYALGGCLTSIGSAQSILAMAFIRSHIEPDFSPKGWLRSAMPMGIALFILTTIWILIRL